MMHDREQLTKINTGADNNKPIRMHVAEFGPNSGKLVKCNKNNCNNARTIIVDDKLRKEKNSEDWEELGYFYESQYDEKSNGHYLIQDQETADLYNEFWKKKKAGRELTSEDRKLLDEIREKSRELYKSQ